MSMDEKLNTILSRHEELASLMSQGTLSGEEFTKYSVLRLRKRALRLLFSAPVLLGAKL